MGAPNLIYYNSATTFELTTLNNKHTEFVIECSKKCSAEKDCRSINVFVTSKEADGTCQAVWTCRGSNSILSKTPKGLYSDIPVWMSTAYDLTVAGKAYNVHWGTDGCRSNQASVTADAWFVDPAYGFRSFWWSGQDGSATHPSTFGPDRYQAGEGSLSECYSGQAINEHITLLAFLRNAGGSVCFIDRANGPCIK